MRAHADQETTAPDLRQQDQVDDPRAVAEYRQLLIVGATKEQERAYLEQHPDALAWAHRAFGNAYVSSVMGTAAIADGAVDPAARSVVDDAAAGAQIRAIVRALGGKHDTRKALVLGVRTQNRWVDNVYIDRYFIVRPDGQVAAFLCSTMPAFQGSNAAGTPQLAPGNYQGRYEPNHDYGRIYRLYSQAGGATPVYRDGNKDGEFTDNELARPSSASAGNSILHHAGNTKYVRRDADGARIGRDGVYSEGCQNLPREDNEAFADFIGAGGYDYTLVDQQRLPLALPKVPFANVSTANPYYYDKIIPIEQLYQEWLASNPAFAPGGTFGEGSGVMPTDATMYAEQ
jgi:hypothetical protein